MRGNGLNVISPSHRCTPCAITFNDLNFVLNHGVFKTAPETCWEKVTWKSFCLYLLYLRSKTLDVFSLSSEPEAHVINARQIKN